MHETEFLALQEKDKLLFEEARTVYRGRVLRFRPLVFYSCRNGATLLRQKPQFVSAHSRQGHMVSSELFHRFYYPRVLPQEGPLTSYL